MDRNLMHKPKPTPPKPEQEPPEITLFRSQVAEIVIAKIGEHVKSHGPGGCPESCPIRQYLGKGLLFRLQMQAMPTLPSMPKNPQGN